MRTTTYIWALLALVTTAMLGQQPPQIGAEYFRRAASLSDIRNSGAVPFRLTIAFKLEGFPREGPIEGHYSRFYASDQRWREELVAGRYIRTEWGSVGGYWRKRAATAEPASIRTLDRLVSYALIIKQHSPLTFVGVSQMIVKGKPAHVVEGRWMGRIGWKYYFDDSTGVLFRIEFPDSSFEYSDFEEFGGKQFPRVLQAYDHNKLMIDAHVQELLREPQLTDAMLTHTAGAEFHPACEGLQWPKALAQHDGMMPSALAQHASSNFLIAVVTATVGVDGKVHDPDISRSTGNSEVDNAAVESVRDWRFAPATCGAKPVPLEIEIPVRLRR